MKKGERLQYACGHWLVAGESGIQDDYAQEMIRKRCGECWRRTQNAAPALLEALKAAMEHADRWHGEGQAGEGRRCTDCIEFQAPARAAILSAIGDGDSVQ